MHFTSSRGSTYCVCFCCHFFVNWKKKQAEVRVMPANLTLNQTLLIFMMMLAALHSEIQFLHSDLELEF